MKAAITDGLAGLVARRCFNGERKQRLLEMYLEAAVKGMFSTAHHSFSPCHHKFEQREPLWDTITTLAFAVEARGPDTNGHSQVVSRLAARIAVEVGLSEAGVEEIHLAGLVHDVRKLHVPDHVLMKPILLTAEEFEIMKSHAALGARILGPLKEEGMERIVRYHHERYDGTGYPDGLKGDDIPIGARIVAVAESFHGMVSDLPYKSFHTFEDALAQLRRYSGTKFDPKVVMAFLDWLEIHGDPREQH